jgi:hypothetical protein
MKIKQYKFLILSIFLISALIVASPVLQQLIFNPQTEHLTELSLLGKNHQTIYPANVTKNENYRLYIDAKNHLGTCAYYRLDVKFRNITQSAPDSFNHTQSGLSPLGSLTFFINNEDTIELPIDISFQYDLNPKNGSFLDMKKITLNGAIVNATQTTIIRDPKTWAFYGNLFFELWLYNDTANAFEYNQRFVSLWLRLNT